MEKRTDIKTQNGTLSNINQEKIGSKKFKLQIDAKKILSIVAAGAIFAAGFGLGKSMGKTENKVNLDPNKIMATIDYDVNPGDTLYEIVDKYYNDDYEGLYASKENFVKSIMDQNSLNNDKIITGQNLTIPVIIDKDNPYFQEIIRIQSKINELEESAKWIKYTVKLDDSLSILAGWGCGRTASAEEQEEIREHNNLPLNTIYPGQEIEIINPKIGNLKIELRKAQQNFKESLINNKKTK